MSKFMTQESPTFLPSRYKFSNMLDTIISNCKHLETPTSPNPESSQSKVSLIYDHLRSENFSPGYSDKLYHKNSAMLDSYLAKKKTRPTKKELSQMLKSSPTNKLLQNSPSVLTFNSAADDDMSQLLSYNKRGFGKKLNDREGENKVVERFCLSTDHSPRNDFQYEFDVNGGFGDSKDYLKKEICFENGNFVKKNIRITVNDRKFKLPPIMSPKGSVSPVHRKTSSMPHGNFEIYTKAHELQSKPPKYNPKINGTDMRKYINHLLVKSLGISQKQPEEEIKKKKPQLESETKEPSQTNHDFLSSGYINYNNDLVNKLRVQKIVIAQHKYERKMTKINIPPVKKEKSGS